MFIGRLDVEAAIPILWPPDVKKCLFGKTLMLGKIEGGKTISKKPPLLGFPAGSEVKASAWNAGDPGSIPGSGRSPGEGNGSPLQYSCRENPMEGGAWWATVHGVAKSWT